MKRLVSTLAILSLAALWLCAPAQAGFGMKEFDVTFVNEDGSPAIQAGSHPYAIELLNEFNRSEFKPGLFEVEGGDIKDLLLETMTGFIGDTTAVPRCTTIDFATINGTNPSCPASTAIGVIGVMLQKPSEAIPAAIFNLTPPPGVPARLGFVVVGVPAVVDAALKQEPDYNVTTALRNSPQPVTVFGAAAQLWGVPSDPAHDFVRGNACASSGSGFVSGNPSEIIVNGKLNLKQGAEAEAAPQCSAEAKEEKPLFTLPRACRGPLSNNYAISSWSAPGTWVKGGVLTHDFATPPKPIGFDGCGKLSFDPEISSLPTADTAETGTGLDFVLDFEDQIDHADGLVEKDGLAHSDIKDISVILPEGVTINPSVGEGLAVCTPSDLNRETLEAEPGEGCPNGSKIGTVAVQTPIAEEELLGDVFLAQQDDPTTSQPGAENPYDTLIAFYIVIKNQNLGVLVKIPAKVEPDAKTGQLITTVEDAPQTPFNRFLFHFKEGQRAPLVTPSACGTYETTAQMTPWARPSEVVSATASFRIERGIGGGACPPGGIPPFGPDFEAGSNNNNAGSFSPFYMRLLRSDGEQDMTKFSSILPPGELGSLRGVSKCPDQAIEAAKSKTGREELAARSCPANSQIGRTLAGAGVGAALTYVPGQIYLAGPYKGDPLSVVSITPAVAGPFDAGTVVIRLALNLNPKTAEVEVDGANSDPIPHIIKGIVLKARDLRVYVDRPNFTLNPTSCDESSAKATLFGSYLDVFSPADDQAVALSDRFQASNCAALGFKPKLALNLKGGTKRGGNPGLKAIYTPRPGDANAEGLVVRLPRSAFLDQAHIRTICTRVQFAADACPSAAQYGYITAWTPLLDEPLQGPVWLRSSNHKLPDLVFDLHGLVDVEVVTRIDSARGGIRASIESAPDAPLSKVIVRMQGGKKGLIVNSRDLCARKSKAEVDFSGQNGKRSKANPVMRAQCGGKGKGKRASR